MPSDPTTSLRTTPPPTDYSLCVNYIAGSHETGPNGPPKRHNGSSHNATANNAMDINVSLHQEKSDLWNPEKSDLHTQYQVTPPIPTTVHSSSVDDYRSVIDDLTLEIQQLKKEIKRYKQPGPALLHKDKLFEIKVHGLPRKKKRELETILRDLATDPNGSPEVSSLRKRTKISPHDSNHMYHETGITRQHAHSSPGSSLRPADSAYASMSAGTVSLRTDSNLTGLASTQSSKSEVEDHLRDVPDGLYPQHVIMTDMERKSLVVRRLEQLFTGRSNDAGISKMPLVRPGGSFIMARVVGDAQMAVPSPAYKTLTDGTEPIREAMILPLEQRSRTQRNNCHSSDYWPASDHNTENMETGGDGDGLACNSSPSSPAFPLSKQRPTRPCDLDPGRAQTSYENINYIRHLDLLPPELLPGQQSSQDIRPDTGGWVSLNLLCNLAQLHLVNVTPAFVRSAVSKLSTRLQLSPDGHKIRWRGGSTDTKFSSYSSGYITPETPPDGNVDGSQKEGKRQKISYFTSNEPQLGGLCKDMPVFDPHVCAGVESFRYKPLFAVQDSSDGQDLREASVCSSAVVDNEDPGESDLGLKYAAGSAGKRQRHEGAITYYSSAGFCIDLTGDPADLSPTLSSVNNRKDSQQPSEFARFSRRLISRSSISYMSLTDRCQDLRQQTLAAGGDNNQVQDLMDDGSEQNSDIELDLIWNNDQQSIRNQPLEPCGLGGVRSDDHFMVFVDTKRPKQDISRVSEPQTGRSNESTGRTICRRTAILTSCPIVGGSEIKAIEESRHVEIEYLSLRTERLIPAPLPSLASFLPPFSTDRSTSGKYDNSSIDA